MTISDEEDEDYTPNGMMNGDDTNLSLRKGTADLLNHLIAAWKKWFSLDKAFWVYFNPFNWKYFNSNAVINVNVKLYVRHF